MKRCIAHYTNTSLQGFTYFVLHLSFSIYSIHPLAEFGVGSQYVGCMSNFHV